LYLHRLLIHAMTVSLLSIGVALPMYKDQT
jgi:hypothetical protein